MPRSVQSHLTPRNPPLTRRRKSGRTRLRACLPDELVGERNHIESLSDGDPRKTPTLHILKFQQLPFLDEEDAS
ncbi:MAG TPA: hypothetical protein VF869_05545 [Jatrophihabitantaceae bacterium]